MFDFLVSLLLVPLQPYLADPNETYQTQMQEVVGNLESSKKLLEEPPQIAVDIDIDQVKPEEISGALLSKPIPGSKTFEEINPELALVSASNLVLSGFLEVDRKRVAIVNDGKQDYMVMKGSYLLNSFQVIGVYRDKIQLQAIAKELAGKTIEINLASAETNSVGEQK